MVATGDPHTHPKGDVMSQASITAFIGSVISSSDRDSNTATPYSTTLNAPFAHVCQASENGVECWRHAEVAYQTCAWLNFPSETRYLCKMHYALLWRMVLEVLKERVREDEKGRVA